MFIPQEQRQHGPDVKVGAIAAAINDTEEMLHRDGWVNGNPRRLGCSQQCVGIALATVSRKNRIEYYRVNAVLLQAAHIQTGKQWGNITVWNDAEGRTIEDVWDLFRIARELVR